MTQTNGTLVTQDKVFQAADDLVAKNERPTQSKIRKVLGGGSFGPIGDFLNDWKSQKKIEHELTEVVIPGAIEARIEQLSKALWQTAMDEAERKLSIEREAIKELNDKANTAVSDANEAVQQLEKEAEDTRVESITKDKLIDDLNVTLNDKNSEIRQLELSMAAKEKVEEENKRLSCELSDVQSEHKIHLDQFHSIKDKSIMLDNDLKNTREKLSISQKNNSEANSNLDDKKSIIVKFEQRNKQLESEKNNLDLQLHKHQSSLDIAVVSLKEAKIELKELHKTLDDKSTENGMLAGELKSLQEQNKKSKMVA